MNNIKINIRTAQKQKESTPLSFIATRGRGKSPVENITEYIRGQIDNMSQYAANYYIGAGGKRLPRSKAMPRPEPTDIASRFLQLLQPNPNGKSQMAQLGYIQYILDTQKPETIEHLMNLVLGKLISISGVLTTQKKTDVLDQALSLDEKTEGPRGKGTERQEGIDKPSLTMDDKTREENIFKTISKAIQDEDGEEDFEILEKQLLSLEAVFAKYKKTHNPGLMVAVQNALDIYPYLLAYYNNNMTRGREWEPEDPDILEMATQKRTRQEAETPSLRQDTRKENTIKNKEAIDVGTKQENIRSFGERVDKLMPYVMGTLTTIAPRLANFLYKPWSTSEIRYAVGLDVNDPVDQEFAKAYVKALMTFQEELWLFEQWTKKGQYIPGEPSVRKIADSNQYIYNKLMVAIQEIASQHPEIDPEKINKYKAIAELINKEKPEIDKKTGMPKTNPDGSTKMSKPTNIIRQQSDYTSTLLAKAESMFHQQRRHALPEGTLDMPMLSEPEASELIEEMMQKGVFFTPEEPHRVHRTYSVDPTTGKLQNQNDLPFTVLPNKIKEYLMKVFTSGRGMPRMPLEALQTTRIKGKGVDVPEISPTEEITEAMGKTIRLIAYAYYCDKNGLHKHASRFDQRLEMLRTG